jgi:hypothetical protein
MNTLREAFERRAGEACTPNFDVHELVGLGEHRLRRRRLAATAGTGAAMALLVALAIAGTAVIRSADQKTGPIDRPSKHPDQTQTTLLTPSRPVVYSDVTVFPPRPGALMGDPIQVGGRAVETGSGFVHMALTDDGVVYATGGYADDGRLWFTNGGKPVQIASHACPSARGWPGSIITGNSGSLAAWFDCGGSLVGPDLVVYDTNSGREVGKIEDPDCLTEAQAVERCAAIIGDRVYVSDSVYNAHGGDLVSAGGDSFARALRNNPRALVIGDSWETGTPTPSGLFVTVGRRLVPIDDGHLSLAFNTATRRRVDLQLPPGYEPDGESEASQDGAPYGLFEWLDDDTIALESFRSGRHDQDILTCRLSTGRCELTVPGLGRDRAYRVVQNENLGNVEFELPE